MTIIPFASDSLDCSVNLDGAQLWSIRDREGRDWQWDGDRAWWTGRAPILFPVVGVLSGGGFHQDGRCYALEKHGFARRRRFELVERDERRALLRLEADEATREHYPFDFRLDLAFAARDRTVSIEATVENRGEGPMPFSFGFHPALRWPLPGGVRDGATLTFDAEPPPVIWRMNGDGLLDHTEPCPSNGRTINVEDRLFTEDAIIFRDMAARGVTFDCGGAAARIEWDNLPDLGLWTKPGAPYLCIEPWQGFNDPVGFEGELCEKPGVVTLDSGAQWHAAVRISV